MTAKEYLSQAVTVKLQLEAMADQHAFLKSAEKPFIAQYGRTPISGTRNIRRSEDASFLVYSHEERIQKLRDLLDEIMHTINSVSNPSAHVILVKRYLGQNTWTQIADEVHFSRSHVFKLHNDALAEITIMLKNRAESDKQYPPRTLLPHSRRV